MVLRPELREGKGTLCIEPQEIIEKLNVFEFALGRTITLSHIRLEMNVEVSLGDILSSHA